MYNLRYQSTPWATHHVVSRCLQGCGSLTPAPHVVMSCADRFKREFQAAPREVRRSIDLGFVLPAVCSPEGVLIELVRLKKNKSSKTRMCSLYERALDRALP
jgi:hypothetical protein